MLSRPLITSQYGATLHQALDFSALTALSQSKPNYRSWQQPPVQADVAALQVMQVLFVNVDEGKWLRWDRLPSLHTQFNIYVRVLGWACRSGHDHAAIHM